MYGLLRRCRYPLRRRYDGASLAASWHQNSAACHGRDRALASGSQEKSCRLKIQFIRKRSQGRDRALASGSDAWHKRDYPRYQRDHSARDGRQDGQASKRLDHLSSRGGRNEASQQGWHGRPEQPRHQEDRRRAEAGREKRSRSDGDFEHRSDRPRRQQERAERGDTATTVAGRALGSLLSRRASPREQREAVATLVENCSELTSSKEFAKAISALGRRRLWGEALSVLSVMKQRPEAPCIISHSAAITACTNASTWEQALQVVDGLLSAGLPLDAIAFSAAISACERGQLWRQAAEYLRMVRDAALTPDVVMCNSVISACGKGQQWQAALSLVVNMRKQKLEPNVITYGAGISACEKGQQDIGFHVYSCEH
eukprot:TRINITY_DN58003_c0_g1_i3.p1 TRINITY_DN58003_c0_g1~~TRINITY_DN58003_c0_g1_i3.p1  ORF type:complete len:372 (-),score=40.94 TRINITY_DN58003_c0_g1_i3:62-1177(-)